MAFYANYQHLRLWNWSVWDIPTEIEEVREVEICKRKRAWTSKPCIHLYQPFIDIWIEAMCKKGIVTVLQHIVATITMNILFCHLNWNQMLSWFRIVKTICDLVFLRFTHSKLWMYSICALPSFHMEFLCKFNSFLDLANFIFIFLVFHFELFNLEVGDFLSLE